MGALRQKPIVQIEKMLYFFQSKKLLPKTAPENLIILYYPSALRALKQIYNLKTEKFFLGELHWISSKIAILSHVGIGSPSLALFLEKAIALGVRHIYSIGTAGSLLPVPHHSWAVATKAYSDEGLTRQYFDKVESFSASEKLLKEWIDICTASNNKCLTGATWTTDAFYRETLEKRQIYLDKNCLFVEMECAALYGLAEYYSISALALFVVSDIVGPTWEPQFDGAQKPLEDLLCTLLRGLHDLQ